MSDDNKQAPTDDEFGGALGDHLRNLSTTMPAPHAAADLMRRARGIRRNRRVGGLALAVAVAVGIAGGVYGVADPDRKVPSPVSPLTAVPASPSAASPSAPPTPAPTKMAKAKKVVDARFDKIPVGAGPTVETVRHGVWYRADGGKTHLVLPEGSGPDTFAGQFLSFNGGLAAETYYPTNAYGLEPGQKLHQRVDIYTASGSRTSTRISVAPVPGANFVHGPGGSVLWTDASTTATTLRIGRLNPDGTTTIYTVPGRVKDARHAKFVAGSDSIYLEQQDDELVRSYQITDGKLSEAVTIKAKGVHAGFPATNEVSLWLENFQCDRHDPNSIYDASAVIDATSRKVKFYACGVSIVDQSADGRYYYGPSDVRVVDDGGFNTVLDSDGDPVLDIKGGGLGAFAPDGSLNLLDGAADMSHGQEAGAVCTIDGDCHRSLEPLHGLDDYHHPTPYAFVQ